MERHPAGNRNAAPKIVQRVLQLTTLLLVSLSSALWSQTLPPAQGSEQAAGKLPAFEVATIKPRLPGTRGIVGFYGYAGGRVVYAGTVRLLVSYAYDVRDYQISGGPAWLSTDYFDITALPPDSSPLRTEQREYAKATPSQEQQQMLRALLADRFGLVVHREKKDGPVYLLTLGSKKLALEPSKEKNLDDDPRCGFQEDGSGFGSNVTMASVGRSLSGRLKRPVLDETGLQGTYDFDLKPGGLEGNDMDGILFDAIDRLGLKLKASKAPIEAIIIESATKPTEN